MKKTIYKSLLLIILVVLSSGCVVYVEKNKQFDTIKIDSTEYSKWYFEKNK